MKMTLWCILILVFIKTITLENKENLVLMCNNFSYSSIELNIVASLFMVIFSWSIHGVYE